MVAMFLIWQDQWWSAHHEWKLNIRADCHDRFEYTLSYTILHSVFSAISYRLWQKVWKGWMEYIRIRVVKRRKRQLAEQFGE